LDFLKLIAFSPTVDDVNSGNKLRNIDTTLLVDNPLPHQFAGNVVNGEYVTLAAFIISQGDVQSFFTGIGVKTNSGTGDCMLGIAQNRRCWWWRKRLFVIHIFILPQCYLAYRKKSSHKKCLFEML